MASTRELWILLRARDEASRVVSSFSKNVRAAALATQAAQKSAEAAAIRQQVQVLKSTGATAQHIRAINEDVVALEKQARAQTRAAASAREQRAELMATIGAQVKGNNLRASGLERQARALTLASAMADEHRSTLVKVTGATDENVKAIDAQISTLRKRAATLNAEAAVYRGASNSLIAQVEKEGVGLENSIRSYERRAAVIRAQAAVLRNQAAEQRINLDEQVRALTDQAGALDRQANALRQSANSAREHDNRMRALTQSMGKVSEGATVAAFALGAIGVGGLIGLKNAIDTTVEYERQVRATATQVDGFKSDLNELGDIGKRVAAEVAVPFESIQPALFDIFSSMEVSMKDAEKLLTSFSKAAVAGQVEIQDVSRATIGLLNAFNRPASDVNKILDMQFQLVQEGIGTYEEWNQRIGLVTPSAVRAGQSIEMMTAALATATRMGMSAARSGTSVARAMDAMSHPAAVKNLAELGVKAQDAQGKFRPMNDVLRDFRAVLMKLPEKERLAAILDVFKGAGGTIEARRFLQNVLLGKGALELFDNVLKETSNSAGSMEKAYGIMADGTAAKSELLRNQWMLLKEAIGKALLPAFNSLIDKLQVVLDWFNKLPDGTKSAIAQFILWGSIISIVLAGMFAFVGVAAIFIAALGTIGVAAGVTLGVIALLPLVILALGLAFYAAYQKSSTFREMINGLGSALQELWAIAVDTGQKIKESWDTNVAPALERLGTAINEKVLPPLRDFANMVKDQIIPKIQEAARIVGDFADGALKKIGDVIDNTVIPALTKMGEWWKQNQSTLLPVIQILGQVVKWMIVLGAIITGVLIAVLVGPLVAAIGAVVIAFNVFWAGIVIVIDFVKQLWTWIQQLWGQLQNFGSSIGAMFTSVWAGIQAFFQGLFNWFQELPGRILGFIMGLPAMLGNLFTTAVNAVAYALGFGLGLVYRFFSEIVPKAAGYLADLPGRITRYFIELGVRAGATVARLVGELGVWWNSIPIRAAAFMSKLWPSIKGHFDSAKQGAATAGNNLVNGFMNFINNLPTKTALAVGKVKAAILNAFAAAGTWLVQAGRDILNGVINGIGGAIGGAVDAARNAAKSMVKGFMDSLKIGSPSKVFRDLGYHTIRGLINGITGSRKALQSAMSKISHDVISSLKAGGASRAYQAVWQKRLTRDSKNLLALEAKRAWINGKIAAAQASLNAQLKARAELAGKIRDKLAEDANITDLTGSSPQKLVQNLDKRYKALQDFSNNLMALKARGLNAETISELALAGPDQVGKLVSTMAKADPNDLKQINDLQNKIRALAGDTGNKVAGGMYDAGISAAQGLIKGLQSQSAAITKEMTKIANALVAAIKKSLGIRSPSKVFEGIGNNTALGYAIGFRKKFANEVSGMQNLMAFQPSTRAFNRTNYGMPQTSTIAAHRTPVNVTVHTNEIDPRRHAAELGWELEGRLNS